MLAASAPVFSQDRIVAAAASEDENQTRELHFAFERMPWRDVVDWLAKSSDLALHVGDLPTGSFTYSDSSPFTVQEAIDRINLFLLPEGFTLVRSGKLLSVINLGDPRGIQQLDALAKMVPLSELQNRKDHDVVKCIFPLGDLDAEDAVEELSALNLIAKPAVFSKTNQLMITETVAKLKSVKTILDAFEPRALDNGTVVKNFSLEHVDAEDVLMVARPHMGLATGEMIGIDVSLSSDLDGKNIFVTGIEDKVKLIEGLVEAIDKPDKAATVSQEDMKLQAHSIKGGNVEVAFNVLQTLLANETARLSMDKTAGTIVALATPDVQAEIEKTVTELEGQEAQFKVIPLKNVDPYFAITLIEQMLDISDPYDSLTLPGSSSRRTSSSSRSRSARDDSPASPANLAPKIDADPGNRRLFVRGTAHQIEQIEKIVAGLETGGGSSIENDEQLRIFPLSGDRVEPTLKTAARFWRKENPVVFHPAGDEQSSVRERIVTPEQDERDFFNIAARPKPIATVARILTDNLASDAPPIRCQQTPRGLLLQSDDTNALDEFEKLLKTLIGPGEAVPSPPIVFYLKYTKANEAIRMLAELMDGGEAAKEFEAGSLVNSYVAGSAGGFLGSIVSSRDGTLTMMAGTITVVADSRLNRLIAQGTADDIELIEGYLRIVDKDDSITSIETYGTSHVIELTYSKATEVAEAIRQAYAGRIAEGSLGNGGQPGSPAQQKAIRDMAAAAAAAAKSAAAAKAAAAKSGGGTGGGGSAPRDLEPKMTIAVHEPSNSLIVTAPDRLFQEVEKLAMLIDQRSRKSVEIIRVPPSVDLESIQEILYGSEFSSGGSAKSSKSKSR